MKTSNILENVTHRPELWRDQDPVQPELSVEFKTAEGRGVFGLRGADGSYKAFMCYSRTHSVPRDIEELSLLTSADGDIIVPYTVWSNSKGAGRDIIKCVVDLVKADKLASRVVTLSPLTGMARKFHIRNGATEFRMNKTTVNFEYEVSYERGRSCKD